MKPKNVKIISITSQQMTTGHKIYGLGDNDKIYSYVPSSMGGQWMLEKA